jgi:hypothetical protein
MSLTTRGRLRKMEKLSVGLHRRTPLVLATALLVLSCGADRRTVTEPDPLPDLIIVTTAVSPGVRGQSYTESVSAQGGDEAYTWEVTAGALPPGLAMTVGHLGADDAIVTGVPEAEGVFTFTLTVTSGDGQSASRSFDLEVRPQVPLSIATPVVPPALAGASYNVRLRAYGGDGETFEWALVAGQLPAGLALSPGGRINGTPAAPDTTTFTVEVRSDGAAVTRAYRLPVVPNREGRYDITIFPVVAIAPGVQAHLDAAVADWHATIQGNLTPVTIPDAFFQAEHCGGFGELLNGTSTDDIIIIVNITPIDGPGGVLGRAGACGVRSGTTLPFAGVLTLDSDDLAPLVGNQTLTHIISHEIAHVLGFGTLWRALELIQGAGTQDPRFVGANAVQEYNALGGTGTVPVENQGGQGTRDAHWRQSVFGRERLTGFSAPPGEFQPLSRVSVASFGDLGYQVDMSAADSFSLAAALAAGAAGEHHHWDQLGYDEILLEPIRVLGPGGWSRTIQPR